MTRLAIAALILGIALPAAADSRKILVMQSEGRADPKLRAKIDATLLRLAKGTGDQVSASDITFADAAAAAGCRPEDAPCKDEVLGMLAVDELVLTTVTPKPGGLEVAVRRVGKSGASRDSTSLIAPEKLDTLDAIAPLFGAKPAAAPQPVAKAPVTAPAPPPVAKAPVTAPAPQPAAKAPAPVSPKPAVTAPAGPAPKPPLIGPAPPPPGTSLPPPAPIGTPAGPQLPPTISTSPAPPAEPLPQLPDPTAAIEPPPPVVAPPVVATPPLEPRDEPPPSRRLQKVGMTAGATLFVAGLAFWASALSVQGEIDGAPTNTKQQLRELQDLEAKGDGYAAVGNVLVIGGAVLGGISTYYFIKKGRHHRSSIGTTARLQPMALERGAGLVLMIGGS